MGNRPTGHLFGPAARALALCVAVPATVAPLHAQTADTAGGQPVGEIVVTAQKRAQNILKVPISVQAVTSEDLAKAGLSSVQDLPIAVPGLMMSQGSATAAPYLRGIGTASPYPGNEAAVAMYIDGVYLPSASANVFSFNDVASIEVLKGPQGTLYGRNATGGVINIKTSDPTFDFSAKVRGEVLNYAEFRGSAYFTVPVSDKVALGIAAYGADQTNGFGRYIPSGDDFVRGSEGGGRVKLLADINDDTQLRIAASYSKISSSKGVGVTLIHDGDDGPYQNIGFYDTLADTPSFNDEETYGGSITLDRDMGLVSVKLIGAYNQVNSNFGFPQYVNPGPAINVVLNANEKTWTGELQFISNLSGPFSFIVGTFYMDDIADFPDPWGYQNIQYTNLGHVVIRNVLTRQHVKSMSGFADLSYELTSNLKLTGGLRYTNDDRSYVGANGLTQRIVNGQIATLPGAPIVSTNSADDKLTYRGVLQWTLGDQMLYGSVSTGFKSGGYSPTTPTNPQIHPESITAYEVGIKGMVADRMVNYSLAGFWYDYSNLQISTVSDGRPVTVNAAAARIRGIEWSVAAKLTPTFSISTNGQYLDTEYTDYRNVRSYVAIPGSMFSALGPLIDATGNHLRIAPEWTIGASVDKTFPLANDSEINVNLTYQYNDGYYFYSDERVRQPSFHLVNARIGWTSPDKQYAFGVFGRNLAGEKYFVAARVSQTNGDFGTYGEPRRYGVYAEAKF